MPSAGIPLRPSFVRSIHARVARPRPFTRVQYQGGTPMKLPRRHFLHLAAGAAALPALPHIARAQAYPMRPVRIVVGFAPGGGADIMARLIGPWLSERFGQSFIIENRPGAGSNIGTEAVVRAPADGYTLLLVLTPNAVNATLYDKLNFNFMHDIIRSRVSAANRTSWWYIHRFRPRPFPSSSPMPKSILARSTWHQPATELTPCGRRTVQDDGRGKLGARALSRCGARAHRLLAPSTAMPPPHRRAA